MRRTFAAGFALLLLAACGQKAEEKKATPPPALITVTQVGSGEFEVVEETLGTLEVLADPKVGAEVPGRVVQVLARTGQRVKKGELLAVIDAGDGLFVFSRSSPEGREQILCVHSVSGQPQALRLPAGAALTDLVGGASYQAGPGGLAVDVAPYQVLWLK